MLYKAGRIAAAASGLMLATGAALAQNNANAVDAALRGIAASSLQAPAAYGSRWRTAGMGFYAQTVENNSGQNSGDGSAAVVLGLGDPDSVVGIDLVASSAALSESDGSDSGFGEAGSFAAKLHRNLPGYTAVAVGINGFGRWGSLQDNSRESVYGVASHFLALGGAWGVIGNLGLGNEAYASPGHNGVGVFGSAALYYTPRYSMLMEYSGRFANAGVSIAPIRSLPATLTVGVINIGGRHELRTEVGASLAVGFNY